jgi:hypothetical protein
MRVSRVALTILLTLLAAAANAAPATSMAATLESDGEPFTGHLVWDLSSPQAVFQASWGNLTCNQSEGEFTIDTPDLDGETEVGEMGSFAFGNNGSPVCPVTLPMVPTCDWLPSTPFDATIEPDALGNHTFSLQAFEWIRRCGGFFGGVDCHYTASSLDGVLNGSIVTFNATLSPEPGSPVICPAEEFEAQYKLETEAGEDVEVVQ